MSERRNAKTKAFFLVVVSRSDSENKTKQNLNQLFTQEEPGKAHSTVRRDKRAGEKLEIYVNEFILFAINELEIRKEKQK